MGEVSVDPGYCKQLELGPEAAGHYAQMHHAHYELLGTAFRDDLGRFEVAEEYCGYAWARARESSTHDWLGEGYDSQYVEETSLFMLKARSRFQHEQMARPADCDGPDGELDIDRLTGDELVVADATRVLYKSHVELPYKEVPFQWTFL